MPKFVTGIHIAASSATAVRLRAGLGGPAVDDVRVAAFGSEPPSLAGLAVRRDSVVVASAEPDSVFQRVVEVPFGDKTKARQAAPMVAEESLPLPLERLTVHTHVAGKTVDGSRVFVAASPVERSERRLGLLHDAGLDPKILDAGEAALAAVAVAALPSAAGTVVIDLDPDGCTGVYVGQHGPEKFLGLSGDAGSAELTGELALKLVSLRDSGFIVRGVYLTGPLAASADLAALRESLATIVEVMPQPKKYTFTGSAGTPVWPAWALALGLALGEAASASSPHVNLLTGKLGRDTGEIDWRGRITGAAVAVGVLVALWAASVAIEASYKKKQLDSVNDAIRQLFNANLPGVKNVVDEVTQLKQRAAEQEDRARTLGSLLQKEVGPLRVLKEMSERIPPDIKVEFREFVAEPDRIRIEGETTSFDSIDRIKTRLAEYPWFSSVTVSDAKAGVDQTKVIFRLTIILGQKEAAQ